MYNGTYAGADSGTFSVGIDASGVLSGVGVQPSSSETYQVAGLIKSDGSLSMSAQGVAGSGVFTGTVNSAGVLSGTWSYLNPTDGSGTFSGQRTFSTSSSTCSVQPGLDRLVFQGAPADFCGFTKRASFSNSTSTYYEFESTTSTGPIPALVKFFLVSGTVDSVVVEDLNKGYTWGCGNAPALGFNYGICSGISTTAQNNIRQFTFNNANLKPKPSSTFAQTLTVNGLLIK